MAWRMPVIFASVVLSVALRAWPLLAVRLISRFFWLYCVSFSSSSRQQRVTAALEMLGHLDIRDKAFDCCHKADQSQGIAVPAAMEYGLAGTLLGLG